MKKKPYDPSLPHQLGKMTLDELNAESDQYDVEFSTFNSPTRSNSRPHPKPRRGRPLAKERAARVLVTMPPALLKRADAFAKRNGTTRAGLIQTALIQVMKRKSA